MERSQRISSEFYCGECNKYFTVHLNGSITHIATIVCPNKACKHEHKRCIVDGLVVENGRQAGTEKERIHSSPTTLRDEPITQKMMEAHKKVGHRTYCGSRRDSIKFDPVAVAVGGALSMADRWQEKAQKEKGD